MENFLAFVFRRILSLRYRVKISGAGKLKGLKGALLLPNHPSETDPVILTVFLRPFIKASPVVVEEFYHAPLIGGIIRLTGAVPMPDMDFGGGRYKRLRVEKASQRAESILHDGGALLFYPSGRLMNSGSEMLKGSSGVLRLVTASGGSVALIRTRGLWGSSFSRALTGTSPDFTATAFRAALYLLRNFIFFMPRRDVSIDIEVFSSDEFKTMGVAELNRFIENWYNLPGPEPISLRPYLFYSKRLAIPVQNNSVRNSFVCADETRVKVLSKISRLCSRETGELKDEMRLGYDLGIDSLTIAEIIIWLNDEFGLCDVEPVDLVTVGDIVHAACGDTLRVAQNEAAPAPAQWTQDALIRKDAFLFDGESISRAFLRSCFSRRGLVAVADEKSGVLTYGKLLLGAVVLSRELMRLEGRAVAIMLPSSVGASLSFFACLLSGKTPVMLNWTSGRRNIVHALKVSGAAKIITSRAFVDMLEEDLDFVFDSFVFLEDVKKSIPVSSKIRGLFYSRIPRRFAEKRLLKKCSSGSDNAVILFTSGSEAMPKCVPLTHRNILSNIDAALQIFSLSGHDVMCSFLPPFHSFGLTATTLLPVLSGVRAVFYPNPNSSRKIASGIRRWGCTLMAGTPSFIKNIFTAGDRAMFSSLHLAVTGAEKAPENLFDLCRSKSAAEILEGYGITECSPIVSVNIPSTERAGVGAPLLGVRVKIVSEDFSSEMPEGGRGLILISGPNVFPGYVGNSPSPFVVFQGEMWYCSGDLGYLERGNLFISGRLKRFVKIGGEMISLPAMEEALKDSYPDSRKGPVLSVVDVDFDGAVQIILVSSVRITIQQANEILYSAGFPVIAKIRRVVFVEKIPLLGSGKADIQELRRISLESF